jgi:acyl-CoA reductase-like NAD-dependent aldehyde dehydrogenase
MQHRMFVDGAWLPARSAATVDATSPATGERLGTVPDGDREDARAAIGAARRAAGGWARLSTFQRAAGLHRVADVIEARRDALARTLTLFQGKPLRAEAYDEVDELVTYWRMAAEDGKRRGGLLPNSSGAGKRALLIGSLQEAVELTNASRYGLLAAVYTADLATGLAFADQVRTGWVNINESTNWAGSAARTRWRRSPNCRP